MKREIPVVGRGCVGKMTPERRTSHCGNRDQNVGTLSQLRSGGDGGRGIGRIQNPGARIDPAVHSETGRYRWSPGGGNSRATEDNAPAQLHRGSPMRTRRRDPFRSARGRPKNLWKRCDWRGRDLISSQLGFPKLNVVAVQCEDDAQKRSPPDQPGCEGGRRVHRGNVPIRRAGASRGFARSCRWGGDAFRSIPRSPPNKGSLRICRCIWPN